MEKSHVSPIRILSPDMDIVGEIDDYESLQFIRRWHKPGEFELHINRHKQYADQLQKGNMIVLMKTADIETELIRDENLVAGELVNVEVDE